MSNLNLLQGIFNCTTSKSIRCAKNNPQPTTKALSSAVIPVPATILTPSDNPQRTQKAVLGRALFGDPILSGGRDVARASCHHSSTGYTDDLDLAIGTNGVGLGAARHFAFPNDIPVTKRITPTILNAAFNGMDANCNYNPATAAMFFDLGVRDIGNSKPLAIQTLEEMISHNFTSATALDSVIARLKAIPAYVLLFNDAFGLNSITSATVAKAIASFERTSIGNNSPYDRYQAGDKTAMEGPADARPGRFSRWRL